MPRRNGPWTIKKRHCKYRNEMVELREDEVTKPDGKEGAYATVKIRDGVEVLALDNDGYVYLSREFRYALGSEDLAAVGGTLQEDETPADAAKRELCEEMGIEAGEWTELGEVHHTTSVIDSTTTLFLARRLTFGEKDEGSSEDIKTAKMKLDRAVEMALNGALTHAASCVLILRASADLQRS